MYHYNGTTVNPSWSTGVQQFAQGPRYDSPDSTIARLMVWFKASDIWAKYFGKIVREITQS